MILRSWFGIALLTVSLGCSSSHRSENDRALDAGVSGAGGNRSSAGAGAGSGGKASSGGASGGSGGRPTAGTSGGSGSDATGGGGGASGSGGSGGQGSGGTDWPACDETEPWWCAPCAEPTGCYVPTFTVNPYGTVSSSCCGEEWTQRANVAETRDWVEAKDVCASLTLLKGGWRLPTIAELYSLYFISRMPAHGAIDRSIFTADLCSSYWSSSEDVQDPYSAWMFIDDVQSPVVSLPKFSKGCVRCVR